MTKRVNRDVSDQFSYLLAKAEDSEFTAYFRNLPFSFAMLGFVDPDGFRLEPMNEERVLRPLRPRAQ